MTNEEATEVKAIAEQLDVIAEQLDTLADKYLVTDPPDPPIPEVITVPDGASINQALADNPTATNFLVEGMRTEVTKVSRQVALEFTGGLQGVANDCLILASSSINLKGGNFQPASTTVSSTIVEAGEYNKPNPPTGLLLDGFLINGIFRTTHALAIHSSGEFKNFTISNVAQTGRETHNIWINDSMGNVYCSDFNLQAGAIGILIGGDVFHLNQIPKGFEFKRGVIWRPAAYKLQATNFVIKNGFEAKGGEDILLEDMEIKDNWAMGQDGDIIVLKATSQYNLEPFPVIVRNVILRRVKVLNSSGGISMGGPTPYGEVTSQITIDDCDLTIDKNVMGYNNKGGTGRALQIQTPVDGIKVLNSRFDCNGSSWGYVAGTGVCNNAEFRNTTVNHGTYGLTGDGVQKGNVVACLDRFFPGAVWEDMTVNIKRKSDGTFPYQKYPAGTTLNFID